MKMANKQWHVALAGPDDFAGWAKAASGLIAAGTNPARVTWQPSGPSGNTRDLFAVHAYSWEGGEASPNIELAADLKRLLRTVILHRDPDRFTLAYRLAWRCQATLHLLAIASDADVFRAQTMAKSVRRDMHKMTAFVRFRKVVAGDGGEAFVAWFEPEHYITRATAPFFMRRFASMRWSILTPDASAHWDLETLTIGDGSERALAPDSDALEDVWRTYYASIFNPARLKVKAMQAEMAKKYWKNLPEAPLIAPLIRSAQSRTQQMIETAPQPARAAGRSRTLIETRQNVPQPMQDFGVAPSLETLRDRISTCARCPLHAPATQAVAGEGPVNAALMIVGEQPGDQEDLAGRPFVGPAGKLLDIALQRSGIAREKAFVTNAVKHFKFEPRGRQRLHKRPDASEIDHCKWWLHREIEIVQPQLILALGATAARSLLEKPVKINEVRGQVRKIASDRSLLITVHPSYLLRLQDEEEKRSAWQLFLQDLTVARDWLSQAGHNMPAHVEIATIASATG